MLAITVPPPRNPKNTPALQAPVNENDQKDLDLISAL